VKYEEIEHKDNNYYIEQLNSNNKVNVVKGLLGIALYDSGFEFIQDTLVRLSKSDDENIHGIAILGFGHIARLYGKIDKGVVMPIVQNGLKDKRKIVRGQSKAALDNIVFFVIYEELQKKVSKVGLDGLRDNEKQFFPIYDLLVEFNNGGFEQYFKNCSGQYYNEAISVLDKLDLIRLSELVKKAKAIYDNHVDEAVKFDLLSELDAVFDDEVDNDELDEKLLSLSN
jgi:hypothetical protein